MRCNEEGLSIIKRYEGLRLKPYRCPAGLWSIGYGITHGITKDTLPITGERAEEMLEDFIEGLENDMDRLFYCPVNDNQWSACVSLAYNIGLGNFRASTLRVLINRREYLDAAEEFPRWNKAGGKVLAGLTKRREEERSLFLRPVVVK